MLPVLITGKGPCKSVYVYCIWQDTCTPQETAPSATPPNPCISWQPQHFFLLPWKCCIAGVPPWNPARHPNICVSRIHHTILTFLLLKIDFYSMASLEIQTSMLALVDYFAEIQHPNEKEVVYMTRNMQHTGWLTPPSLQAGFPPCSSTALPVGTVGRQLLLCTTNMRMLSLPQNTFFILQRQSVPSLCDARFQSIGCRCTKHFTATMWWSCCSLTLHQIATKKSRWHDNAYRLLGSTLMFWDGRIGQYHISRPRESPWSL